MGVVSIGGRNSIPRRARVLRIIELVFSLILAGIIAVISTAILLGDPAGRAVREPASVPAPPRSAAPARPDAAIAVDTEPPEAAPAALAPVESPSDRVSEAIDLGSLDEGLPADAAELDLVTEDMEPALDLSPDVETLAPPPAVVASPSGLVRESAIGNAVTVVVGLRLRAQPSTSSAIVTSLPRGTRLEILSGSAQGSGYKWARVRTASGAVGWVATIGIG